MFLMYIFIPNNVCLAMKLKICHYGCELKEMRVDVNVFYFDSSFQFHLRVI